MNIYVDYIEFNKIAVFKYQCIMLNDEELEWRDQMETCLQKIY